MPEAGADLAALRHLTDAGYNFYQSPATHRADDLLVRAEAAAILHRAATALTTAEHQSRAAIPAPTREQPFPEAARLARPRALRALLDQVASLQTRLHGPVSLPDADFSAGIASDATRATLVHHDAALLAAAAALEATALSADVAALQAALSAMDAALQARAHVR